MSNKTVDFAHLILLIQRLEDADMLLQAETSILLEVVEAARQAREQGDAPALQQRLEDVAGFIESLVHTQALPLEAGGPVVQAARGLSAGA